MSSKGIAGFNAGLVKSVNDGYTPTEWATGDVITAEKLNNMESGIERLDASKLFIVKFDNIFTENISCDKTYEEIKSAFENGKTIFAYSNIPASNIDHPIIYTDCHITASSVSFEHSYFYNTTYSGQPGFAFDFSAISINSSNEYIQRRFKFETNSGSVTQTYPVN